MRILKRWTQVGWQYDVDTHGDMIIVVIAGGKAGKGTKKVWITDGTKEAFPGLGIFFIRTISKAITTSNIAQVTST